MDYRELIETMSPAIYQSLRLAVEKGKWPDGKTMTAEQRETTLQAVIAWGERHLPPEERVGFIKKRQKNDHAAATKPEKLAWRD
jgi:uncharacterized protein YeaC (DUF1315 family)